MPTLFRALNDVFGGITIVSIAYRLKPASLQFILFGKWALLENVLIFKFIIPCYTKSHHFRGLNDV